MHCMTRMNQIDFVKFLDPHVHESLVNTIYWFSGVYTRQGLEQCGPGPDFSI